MKNISVRAQAPGKVNVFFAVGPARADGYHSVASLYAATDLHETVTVTMTPEIPVGQVQCTVEVVQGSLVAQQQAIGSFALSQVPVDRRNLAVRAVEAVFEHAGGISHGVHVHIHKAVPVAGGMGGGSADAAAAVKAAARLVASVTGSAISHDEILRIARTLGADVPFALTGGAAVGTGTGADLVTVPVKRRWPAVLVADEGALSTPEVFSRLDQLRAEAVVDTPEEKSLVVPQKLLHALSVMPDTSENIFECVRNDLEVAALDLLPHLRTRLAWLRSMGAFPVVSGSGPTIIALTPNKGMGQQFTKALRRDGLCAVSTVLG